VVGVDIGPRMADLPRRRVLRPDGALVLSRQPPFGDWLRHGGSDVEPRVVAEV